MKRLWILLSLSFIMACSFYLYGQKKETFSESEEKLYKKIKKLELLHTPLTTPKPGEWLYSHPEEGQTFKQYLQSNPVLPTEKRHTIYIQPLGSFSKTQYRMVELAGEFMELYFGLPIKLQETLPLSVIADSAKRKRFGTIQLLSTHILNEVLAPKLPQDAAVYIAFTASDLWPGEGWNFVFGQASLRERVGVWSIHRYGDPDRSAEDFRTFLSRTLKTATHETGHMFSMQHCIAWSCNLNGSNSLEESDQKPLWLCPECLAKICWAQKLDPTPRYQKLADFCKKQGFQTEQTFFLKSIEILDNPQ